MILYVSVFADSSAIVKLYADEPGYDDVRALAAVAIAQIARVEVPAAFWRKHRLGELSVEDTRALTADFEADYYGTSDEVPRFVVVATTVDILDDAARLCATHGLRAYDAVQLSTAMATRRADPACSAMAAFDSSLRAAASAEGLEPLPASNTYGLGHF
ncbi:MAG: type II toxin-antitoxin system VapC family toxin [Actinomycetota bacterium]|nr:type II toxin-antitoxin system VapC family toxin [Actinomycetota bacterium]